jgi:aminoglycoside phosphotransferase (APT) family kinase protein
LRRRPRQPPADTRGDDAEARVSLADEVDRWLELFRSLDDPLTDDFERCARLLHEQEPAELPGVILHGDYRLGNMLSVDGSVEAIIDWEIWSIGDPRNDVAWFLMNCDDVDQPTAIRHN